MTSFLSFHAAAAARGDGLRPELFALRVAPRSELAPRHDGMIQSRLDPASSAGARTNRANSNSVVLAADHPFAKISSARTLDDRHATADGEGVLCWPGALPSQWRVLSLGFDDAQVTVTQKPVSPGRARHSA